MKKLLTFLTLFLMLMGVAGAKIINLDQGIKVFISQDYEYLQLNHRKYFTTNLSSLDVNNENINKVIKNFNDNFGFIGTETVTVIGRKGFAKNLDGVIKLQNKKENWSGANELSKNCQIKDLKKFLECFVKYMKFDPMIELVVGKGQAGFKLKQQINFINNIFPNLEKYKNEEFFVKAVNGILNSEGNGKIVRLGENKWGIEIRVEDKITETDLNFLSKRVGYLIPHNNSFFIAMGNCFSKETCQNINNLVTKIIEPYLSSNNIDKSNSNSNSVANDLMHLNELYKSGALTKEEFEKAKKKILN